LPQRQALLFLLITPHAMPLLMPPLFIYAIDIYIDAFIIYAISFIIFRHAPFSLIFFHFSSFLF